MTSEYDMVIVGGGLGGSALARVIASSSASVFLVERETRFPKFSLNGDRRPTTFESGRLSKLAIDPSRVPDHIISGPVIPFDGSIKARCFGDD